MTTTGQITGKTKVLAVLGNPVAHSLSPQMHNAWIADHGLDAVYVALPLARTDAEETLRAVQRLGLHGANVTVPFKEAAARATLVRSLEVTVLGVANTLRRDERGVVHAHNTDAEGARRALDEAHDWTRDVREVLIVGAGGAARAIAHGLAGDGRRIAIANRTRDKAETLATSLGGDALAIGWTDLPRAFSGADLVVNASSLGMAGQETIAWPVQALRPGSIVFDAVYAPLETDLLKAARARGLRTVDGLGMLIHQGALAFELWFGVKPDTAKARERLLKILPERGS